MTVPYHIYRYCRACSPDSEKEAAESWSREVSCTSCSNVTHKGGDTSQSHVMLPLRAVVGAMDEGNGGLLWPDMRTAMLQKQLEQKTGCYQGTN